MTRQPVMFGRGGALCALALTLLMPAPQLHAAEPTAASELAQPGDYQSLITLSRETMLIDPAAALELAERAEPIAAAVDVRQQIEALWLQGEGLLRLGRPAEGMDKINEAERLIEEANAKEGDICGRLLLTGGRLAVRLSRTTDAIEHFVAAEKFFEEAGNARQQAIALQEIGSIHADAEDWTTALEYYARAKDRYHGDPGVATATENNRAGILVELERFEEGREAYESALDLAQEIESPLLYGQVLSNLAALEVKAGNVDVAERHIEGAFAALSGPDGATGRRYVAGTRAQIAEARGNYEDAARHLEEAFSGLDPTKTDLSFRTLHGKAADVYERLGQWERAYLHRSAEQRLGEEAKEVASSALLATTTAEYRSAEQQLKIERLKNEQLLQSAALDEAERREQRQAQLMMISSLLLFVFAGAAISIAVGKRRLDTVNDELSETVEHLGEEVRQRLEAERRLVAAKEKAEEANRSKSTFLATISHELRTPMNGILGFTEVLLSDDVSENQREQLEIIDSSGRSLLTLINDILDLSQIEAGALKLRSGAFVLRDMTERCVQLLRARAQERNLGLIAHVSPELPDEVVGDEDRIRQVLINLVGNAIKFTSSGMIAVSVCRGEEGRIRFEVRDTGQGIPEEKRDRLFKRFSQIENGEAPSSEGSGLGLSISQDLIAAMGGRIGCRSKLGKGSVFWFEIPLESSGQEIIEAQVLTPETPCTVAIIDDLGIGRATMASMLRARGIETLLFGSDTASLEELTALRSGGDSLRAVFINEATGGAMTREQLADLRRIQANGSVPFVFYGGTEARTGVKTGACDYILSHPVLDRTIDEVLPLLRPRPEETDRSEGSAVPAVEILEPASGGACETPVLIVDDVLANRKLAETVLEKAGFRTVLARDGEEAVELASVTEFGAILMDVYMPRMDGLQATRTIREGTGPNASSVIVAVTASCTDIERNRIIDAGVDAIVTKPVNFDELRRVVSQVHEERRARRESERSG